MRENPGVELAHYLDEHPAVDVQIICEPCAHSETLPMAGVVRRLTEMGRDARAFGICAVADLITKACPACGARKWSSRPAWGKADYTKPGPQTQKARPTPLGADRALSLKP